MNYIKNQIAFITERKNNSFEKVGLNNIEHILRKAQMVFNRWIKIEGSDRTTDTFVEMMDLDYFKLLDTITIAHSRKHIQKDYGIEETGEFSVRNVPKNKKCDIDALGQFPTIAEVNTYNGNKNYVKIKKS